MSPVKAWREFGAFRHALRGETLHGDPRPAGAGEGRDRRAHRARQTPRLRPATASGSRWRRCCDDVHHRIPRDRHFIDKARALAAAALGYTVSGPPRWQFAPPATTAAMPAAAVRARVPRDEPRRQAVARRPLARGPRPVRERRHRDAAAVGQRRGSGSAANGWPRAPRRRSCLPRQTLAELATLARHAEAVVGVDTGLTHLAAALGTPTVAVFTTTDAALAGVARAGDRTRSTSAGTARCRRSTTSPGRSAACCATRRDADARALHAAVGGRAAVAAAAPVVARPARARLSPADRRTLRPLRRRAGAARRRRRLDPRGVAGGDARRGAARGAHRARPARGDDPADAHDGDRARGGPRAVRQQRRAGVAAVRLSVRRARVPRALFAARRRADGNRAVAEPGRGVRGRARAAVPRQCAAVGALVRRLPPVRRADANRCSRRSRASPRRRRTTPRASRPRARRTSS